MEKKEREEILELKNDKVEDNKGRAGTIATIIMGIIMLILILAVGYWAWLSVETAKEALKDRMAKEKKRSEVTVKGLRQEIKDVDERLNKIQSELDKLKEALAAEQAAEQEEKTLAESLESATVKEAKGIENVYITQLLADPYLLERDSNLVKKYPQLIYTGDSADKRALKEWAQRAGHILAGLFEYYDLRFGAEVRVKHANKVAYHLVIDNNGKLVNRVYLKDKDGNFSSQPQITQELTKDFPSVKFKADKAGGMQPYEYLFLGG